MANMPINEIKKKLSAILSNHISFFSFSVLIEINENTHETLRSNAIRDVSSSIRLFSDLLVKCSDETMIRQKPSRLAAVFKMCCEVLFAKIGLFQTIRILVDINQR